MCAWIGRAGNEFGAEPSPTGEREPIAVFGIDGIVEGSIPKLEGRMSDGLSQAARVHLRTSSGHGGAGAQLTFDVDKVVAVAAPPRPPSPYRTARRQHALDIQAGPYRVHGVAHLPLGADPTRYVASRPRRWLPLTDCTVSTGDDEWAIEVVIVNLDHASRERVAHQPPSLG